MIDLNKYIFKPDNHQPIHTSGFAYVANGEHMGASAKTSFRQRQQINSNRRVIKSYTDSKLGKQYNNCIPKIDLSKKTRPAIPTRSQARLNIPARHVFSEPKSSGYDPYHVK